MTAKYQKNPSTKKWSVRVWWTDEKGKRESIQKSGFETKIAAKMWAEEKSDTGERSSYPDAHKLTLGRFLDDWIKMKESKLSPTTLNGYWVNIRKIKESLGHVLVQNLRMDMIQSFIDGQSEVVVKKKVRKSDIGEEEITEEIKAAPNTIRYILRTLHSALQYAIKAGIVQYNPADNIDLPADREFNPATLGAEDVLTLITKLKQCGHILYLPVLLSVMHGLRRGEALGLRWADIDLENGTMHICNNYTVAGNILIEKGVKTKESDATIPMMGFVAAELKQIHNDQVKTGRIEKYVCACNGSLPDPRHISAFLGKFQRANKLPVCRFHDLRHSFAGIALDSGTDMDTLKHLMRHSKIAVTERYLHANVTREKSASLSIENAVLKHKA